MREQIKAPEKNITKQWRDNLPVISFDAEIKTLVITMLTEMVEYGSKTEEEVKTMRSEIKENAQGTNSDGKETRTQINSLEQKEEINIQLEQNEGTRIQKIWVDT